MSILDGDNIFAGNALANNIIDDISTSIKNSSINAQTNKEFFKFDNDKIIIGELSLTQPEFETCIKYLLKITKEHCPEDFI